MSDEQKDLETDDAFDTDLGFEDSSELGDQGSKNRALIKLGVLVVAVVVVLGAVFFIGGSGTESPTSRVDKPPTETKVAATEEPTPEIREAVNEYNSEQVAKAEQTGASVMPVIVEPPRTVVETRVQEQIDDPAERFRRIQEEYRKQQEQQAVVIQQQQRQQVDTNKVQAISQMTQQMAQYLQAAAQGRQPKSMRSIALQSTVDQTKLANMPGAGSQQGGLLDTTDQTVEEPVVLVPAATVEYGQLLIEANTDAPGPVLALLLSGKLSGSRMLGSFQKTDEFLTINFKQLVTKKGKTIPVSAIVLDPDTTLPGVITEIDHRYFSRYIVPAAADFVSGVGEAIAETQTGTNQGDTSTVTTNEDPDFSEAISQGISDAFDGLSDTFKAEAGKTQPMLRVAAGTPIGILFTADVVEPQKKSDVVSAGGPGQNTAYQTLGNAFGATPYGALAQGAYGAYNAYGNANAGAYGASPGGLTNYTPPANQFQQGPGVSPLPAAPPVAPSTF